MDLSGNQESQQEIAKKHEKLVKQWAEKLKNRSFVKDASLVDEPDKFSEHILPPGARVLEGPTAVMTMDYRIGRLNVHLDKDGKFDYATAG